MCNSHSLGIGEIDLLDLDSYKGLHDMIFV